MRQEFVNKLYINVRKLEEAEKTADLYQNLNEIISEKGHDVPEILKDLMALAIKAHDRPTFELMFRTYREQQEAADFDATTFKLPESAEEKLWDLYADINCWGRDANEDLKMNVSHLLRHSVKSYFKNEFLLRNRGHMVKVFNSLQACWSPARTAADIETIRVLDRYATQMPFASRCLYERKVRGRGSELLLFLSNVGVVTLLALLVRFTYPAAIEFRNCMALLPSMIGFASGPWSFAFSFLAKLTPTTLLSFVSWLYTYLIWPACWAINAGLIAPILFFAAWLAPVYCFYKIAEFCIANLFSSPPDFEPFKALPLNKVFMSNLVSEMSLAGNEIATKLREVHPSAPPAPGGVKIE